MIVQALFSSCTMVEIGAVCIEVFILAAMMQNTIVLEVSLRLLNMRVHSGQ